MKNIQIWNKMNFWIYGKQSDFFESQADLEKTTWKTWNECRESRIVNRAHERQTDPVSASWQLQLTVWVYVPISRRNMNMFIKIVFFYLFMIKKYYIFNLFFSLFLFTLVYVYISNSSKFHSAVKEKIRIVKWNSKIQY